MADSEILLSFWDHLKDLRKTILRTLLVVAIGFIASLVTHEQIFELFTRPLQKLQETKAGDAVVRHQTLARKRIVNDSPSEITYKLPKEASSPSFFSDGVSQLDERSFSLPTGGYIDIDIPEKGRNLLILGPIEGMIITLKVCFWVGLVATSPLWIYFIFQFIAPALRSKDRRLIIPFLLFSLSFMTIGFLFAFFLTIPIANQFLHAFNTDIGTNFWSLSQYLDYTVLLLLAHGLAFELFVVLLFLVHFGILSAEMMSSKRRHVIVVIFILAAIFTPPDVATQLMLAVPMIFLYEVAILYARIRRRKSASFSIAS